MAHSSKRMRFKDKIIANIAKAIKGIQEAVFYKSHNQVYGDDSPLILHNNDRQCHKLCENLDHVFLHGLRKHSNGYWKIVTEFTHRNAIKEIQKLQNVTTDLGRGRAWIFMALNDCLLESYIRCLTENTRLLKKHYDKDALLLDQQQMSVLLTLTSGLECVVFELEFDLPYLDLTAYPPRTRTGSENQEDEEVGKNAYYTLGSVSRNSSEAVAYTPDLSRVLTDSDTTSLNSIDATDTITTTTPRSLSNGGTGSNRVSFVSLDSGFPGDILSPQSGGKLRSGTPSDTISLSSHSSVGEPDRLTRLENIVTEDIVGNNDASSFEVIRVKGGKKVKKKKGASVKKSDGKTARNQMYKPQTSNGGDGDDVFETSLAARELNRSVSLAGQNSVRKCSLSRAVSEILTGKSQGAGDVVRDSLPVDSNIANDLSDRPVGVSTQRASESSLEKLATDTKDLLSEQLLQLDNNFANVKRTASMLHSSIELSNGLGSDLKNVSSVRSSDNGYLLPSGEHIETCFKDSDVVVSPGRKTVVCDNVLSQSLVAAETGRNSTLSALQKLESKCEQLCTPLVRGDSSPVTAQEFAESSVHQAASSEARSEVTSGQSGTAKEESRAASVVSEARGHQEDDEIDFYSAVGSARVGLRVEDSHKASQLQDYVDYVSGHHHHQQMEEDLIGRGNGSRDVEKKEWTKDYALRLDNNAKLQIMLEVFSKDNEEFIKMFACREGQSEGEMKVVFVLITNHALYLLNQRVIDRKFETAVHVPLRDLSFITLSLNKQIINIESSGPNRKKERIWLTPGDHLLAQQILDCLESVMQNIQNRTLRKPHCTVGSDEPLQIIALRKYIARDSNCEISEQEVEIMDYSLVFWEDAMSNKKPSSTSREGTMLLRVSDPFKGHNWKPVYVVLRDFMLCIFADKSDSKPQLYVQLGGEQCIGCRMTSSQDRPYCIEIILAKGGSWFLSVATEGEVASWRHDLCLAVSEGMQDSASLYCLPCVSVVTKHKLLLCHEDVQTKFFRTIASAKVEEITTLSVDPDVSTFCIVEFESQEEGVTTECWVLYFNSPLELERFVRALSAVWQTVYHVPLSAGPVEDMPLLQRCQNQVSLLEKAVTLK